MADHGTVQYSTAAGNDLPAHEASYEQFVHFAVVGILFCVNVCFGLATGGVMGHWFWAAAIFIIGALGAVPSIFSGSRTPSIVSFVLCFLIFAMNGLSGPAAH